MSQTHVVLKISDINNLPYREQENLEEITKDIRISRGLDGKKTEVEYIVVNMDEPYSQDVLELVHREEFKLAKVFEFRNDETYWIVAKDIESAKKILISEYGEEEMVEDEATEVKEVSRDFHTMITDDEDGAKMDIWEMIERDIKKGVKLPFMAATTIW